MPRERNRGQRCADQQNQYDVLEEIRIDHQCQADDQEQRLVNALAIDEVNRSDGAEDQAEKERQRLARSMWPRPQVRTISTSGKTDCPYSVSEYSTGAGTAPFGSRPTIQSALSSRHCSATPFSPMPRI